MSNIKSYVDAIMYTNQLIRSNRKGTSSWVQSVQEVVWHNPTTVIAALALIVSFFALLSSRRAARVAEQAYAEHGKIRGARIEFCGLHFGGQKGLLAWESAPLPKLESSHVTRLVVYGGPDPLRIEQLQLRVAYTWGKVFVTRLLLTVAVGDLDLQIEGPDVPVAVEAYHPVIWRLPELLIAESIYRSRPDEDVQPPGVFIPMPFESLEFQIRADYGDQHFRGMPMKYGWLLPFCIVKETRPIRSIAKFLSDPDVPTHVKRLFEQWYRQNTIHPSPRESSKAGSASRRSNRRRRL